MRRQVQQVVAGNQNWSTAIMGVTPEYQTVRDWPVAAGRFLNKQEEESAATSAVLGQTVVQNLGLGRIRRSNDSHQQCRFARSAC